VSGRVKPLGLAQQGTRLYLVCHFDGFAEERSLALNRIESATATNLPFARPAAFDLEKFDGDGGFGFGSGKRIRLELLIDKGAGLHLLESKLSSDQTEKLEGDKYRIRATVVESEQLKWWLRGFGKAVRVVAPVGLARTL
jgi:predicted DNA-binding transcriptional regulator YafY